MPLVAGAVAGGIGVIALLAAAYMLSKQRQAAAAAAAAAAAPAAVGYSVVMATPYQYEVTSAASKL